ncbi:MAG TPA: class I SAM-dependent methyltransferase [Allosphingosinicella sp.]|jgi:SAM-dependent methyltransferase
MTGTDNRKPWADFWAGKAGERQTACIPDGLKDIDQAQRAAWQAFAAKLPAGARVLDLATGDGAVLKKIREVRSDLQLVGVDSAPSLPPSPPGISLRAGVSMESMPFKDGSFDAVVSQFGYEYGDTRAIAGEVGRLLRPGGGLALLIHRSDGPIVAHNLPRRDALRWALAPGGYLSKARALAGARRLVALPTPAAFRSAADEAQRLYPGQSVGAEFLTAVWQTLEMGRSKPPNESLEVFDTLEKKALNEIERIETLERAACDPARIKAILAEVEDAGLDVQAPAELIEGGSGRSFAWWLSATRRG